MSTVLYVKCLREFTEFRPTQLVILMATDGAPQAQCFVEPMKPWVEPLMKTVSEYDRRFREKDG